MRWVSEGNKIILKLRRVPPWFCHIHAQVSLYRYILECVARFNCGLTEVAVAVREKRV